MATWLRLTNWTFQQSSELGGGVVNKVCKKKSRERAIGGNREVGKKGRGKRGHTTFICVAQKST